MLDKGKHCHGCPLEKLGRGFASTGGEGTTTGVLVVAEALGTDEANSGQPLVGAAGRTWASILGRIPAAETGLGRAFDRSDFLLDNCIHCQPPGNALVGAPYEAAALSHCRPYLTSTLQRFAPKAILTLGNTPLKWFTGQWGIEQLRGYVFPTAYGPVVPTYHPSYIMRGKWNLARVVQMDVLKAVRVAREGAACLHVEKVYELSPSYGDVQAFLMEWRAAGRPPLAFDIETPRAGEAGDNEEMTFEEDASYQILMISLAWQPYKAISIPWVAGLKELVIEALAEQADYLVWNAPFDVPRLMANGVTFGGRVVDVMLAWHWLEPALPMGLKWVATLFCPDMHAWKLDMHHNFQWYNAADSDVLLRVYLEVKRRLTEQGRWKTFERHFLDFGKVLAKLTSRGVAVDHEARAIARTKFQARFEETVKKTQELAPAEILHAHPKRGYAKEPKDTTGMVRILVDLTPAEEERKRKAEARKKEQERKRWEIAQRKLARAAAKEAKLAQKAAKAARRKKNG